MKDTVTPLMLDSYQVAVNAIGIVQLLFIGLYFGSYGQPGDKYVSDLLFEIVPYKVLMTVFVGVQCVFCFMFVVRLMHALPVLFWIQIVSIVACLVGWITLNTKYLSDDGKTSDTHKYGTLVFMLGMGLYFVCMMYAIRSFLIHVSRDVLRAVIAYLVVALFLTTIALGIVFVVGLFDGIPNAWVYEHSAFMAIVLAHIAFFSLESPNPWLPFSDEAAQYAPIPSSAADVKITEEDLRGQRGRVRSNGDNKATGK